MTSRKRFVAATLFMLLALVATAWAQSDRGSITGTVTDPGGAIVPKAKVTATSLDTGAVREATTSDDGHYTLPELKGSATGLPSRRRASRWRPLTTSKSRCR
jgi:hypothetical protein